VLLRGLWLPAQTLEARLERFRNDAN